MLKSIDAKCSGCRACLMACAITNHREVNPTLAALTIEGCFPEPGGYQLGLCDQCGVCAEVCPEEAISQNEGIPTIDAEICTGCETCIEACPHQVMGLHHVTSVAFKCTDCGECARVCPRGALIWEALEEQEKDAPARKEVAS